MPDANKTKATKNSQTQGHRVGFFHSFCEYPTGITFQNQEDDEQIVLFVRRDFITNVPWIIITILLLILPFAILPLLQIEGAFPFALSEQLVTILVLFYYLIVFGYAFINLLSWFYNIGIVADRSVTDIDYSEIVNVRISATKVSQIEDVTYQQDGFFKTFFNYGDVLIQTAAEAPEFEFSRIPNPARAVDLIRQLIGPRKK